MKANERTFVARENNLFVETYNGISYVLGKVRDRVNTLLRQEMKIGNETNPHMKKFQKTNQRNKRSF